MGVVFKVEFFIGLQASIYFFCVLFFPSISSKIERFLCKVLKYCRIFSLEKWFVSHQYQTFPKFIEVLVRLKDEIFRENP